MAEASIPVDVLNPGQVFACLGLMEAAAVLLGGVEGTFDWSHPSEVLFRVRANGEVSPVIRVLQFLDGATATAVAPTGSKNLDGWLASWGEQPEQRERAEGYPFSDPPSPATLVTVLRNGSDRLEINHYGDETERDNVKFWAGAAGYPAAALSRDALALIAGRAAESSRDPFALSAPQSSSFRLDWRRDYIPIDAGFSINSHGNVQTVGFPVVELLGAIGLTHARPRRPNRRNKLQYLYGILGRAADTDRFWLPPSLLRAALGAVPLPFPQRLFRMLLDWPGQEGQARSITVVTEETIV